MEKQRVIWIKVFSQELFYLKKKGPPPEVNLFNEKNNGETVLKLSNENLIVSCHDISVGGILTALSKMCIKGNKGAKINSQLKLLNKFNYFFAEDQGRYIIEIKEFGQGKKILGKLRVYFDELGVVAKDNLEFEDDLNISIKDLGKKYKSWLENYIVGEMQWI